MPVQAILASLSLARRPHRLPCTFRNFLRAINGVLEDRKETCGKLTAQGPANPRPLTARRHSESGEAGVRITASYEPQAGVLCRQVRFGPPSCRVIGENDNMVHVGLLADAGL
jgi:hypothetical protein